MFVLEQQNRSRTIGSSPSSLSVGEPGDPGCGWNTEGDTEHVKLSSRPSKDSSL